MPNATGAVRTSLVSTVASGNYNITFSPGTPLAPSTQQPTRGWDFPVNVNATVRPRAYEPFGFPHLRAFSNVELVRLAIETRKDQIERQNWAIKPRDNKKGTDSRIDALTKFWAKPDGVKPFATFIRAMVEDLLAIDAPAAELRRTRGGKLIAIEYIPGDTIAVKVDDTGRIPRDPNAIAYQQVIKGTVWNDLRNRDILYVPRNIRPGHVYGHGPVEQIVVTINTIMRRQAAQLAHFTASNIPSGLLNAPEGWNLDKIKELQDWLDDQITGNTSEQAKVLWGPAGTKYQAFKDNPIKDDFDEWLARVVAFAFSLPPTPFVRQMNKGTANEDQDRALEEGLEPLKLWAKRWIDDIIATEFDAPDLEFVFIDTPSIDPAAQSKIDDMNLRNGTTTLDEVRDARGQDPLPDGMGKEPLIYTSTGPVLLKDVLAAPEATPIDPGAPQQVVDDTPPQPAPAPKEIAAATDSAKPSSKPEDAPAAKSACGHRHTDRIAKAAQPSLISPDRPKARRHTVAITKAIKPILTKSGDEVAADVASALKAIAKAEADPQIIASAVVAKLDLSALMEIADAIEDDLADLASDSGILALHSVTSIGADDDSVNVVNQRAVAYAKSRAAELVSVNGDQSLIDSTRAMIRDTIANGLEGGMSGSQIADALQESYAFSAQRANLIANTEIATANGQGKKAGWEEVSNLGITLVKEWFVSGDEGVCEDCDGNESQGEIPFDEAFQSGDDIEPAHPGCRCVTAAHSVADDGTETDSED